MSITTPEHDKRIAELTFSSVYPHYLNKVEKKGKTKEELHQVITWLTGYSEKKLKALIDREVTFDKFFEKCKLNPNAHLITGVICGYRVEELENELQPSVERPRSTDEIEQMFELLHGKTAVGAHEEAAGLFDRLDGAIEEYAGIPREANTITFASAE